MQVDYFRAWYPCIVISNEMYPDQKDANLGKLGFVAVQWAVWRNRITYNVIPYNRLIPMSVRDYFFVVDGPDYECYEGLWCAIFTDQHWLLRLENASNTGGEYVLRGSRTGTLRTRHFQRSQVQDRQGMFVCLY